MPRSADSIALDARRCKFAGDSVGFTTYKRELEAMGFKQAEIDLLLQGYRVADLFAPPTFGRSQTAVAQSKQ